MNPVLDDLRNQVEQNTQVEASAAAALNGFAGRVQDAVDQALANGATAEQLAPVQTEVDALKSSANDLAAAVAANTPSQPLT